MQFPAQGSDGCSERRRKKTAELERLRIDHSKHQRVCSFGSTSSTDTRSNWTRAELDSPADTSSWSCFGEKPKFSSVIAYEPGLGSLKAQSRKELHVEAGDRRIIYSRLPSRRTNTIYVFAESSATGTSSSTKRFRVATRAKAPDGFVPHWTLHLKSLSWNTRVKIWTGRVKWVYILLEPESQRSTMKLKSDCTGSPRDSRY